MLLLLLCRRPDLTSVEGEGSPTAMEVKVCLDHYEGSNYITPGASYDIALVGKAYVQLSSATAVAVIQTTES